MGRNRRPEWQYVTQVKALPKGQWTCKCIYCGHTFDGGPLRIRGHLLSIPGHGVGGCTSVNEEIKVVVRRLHADVRSDGQESTHYVDALVDELGENAFDGNASQDTFVDAQGSGHASASSGHAAHASASSTMPNIRPMSKKRTATTAGLSTAFGLQARKNADQALRRFFYAEDISHWKVRSAFFLDMVKAIGEVGSSYVPPTYNALRTTELNAEIQCIRTEIMGVREKWKKYGCTIVCDGWSDTRHRPLINFLACSINGSVFLKSVDTSGETKTSEFIFKHVKEAILEVGPANVVQVCMDNATNCVGAGELVEREWKHIFFTRCTCHCLDLLFEDIGKIDWIASVLENASRIVTFITRKERVLALFRALSKRDLVKPAATRFAYYFIMLSTLLDDRCMQGVRKLMCDDKYTKLKVSRSTKGVKVMEIVFNASFWHNARLILKICAPILKILRLCDREGATMGLVYELTDRMVERIQNMQGVDADKLEEIKSLCIDRWNMMHTPLHAVGYILHPVWRGKGQYTDGEVHEGWMSFLDKYTNGDLTMQGILIDELDIYKTESKSFAHPIAKDPKRMQEGVKWWETFGACTPTLQAVALKVLSQGTCASPCERNWSTFSLIHTSKRNRLLPSHLEKLVFIHTNLRLISKIKERGYERMEVTLDMLNKEKDEDRLLALQEVQDAIAESAHDEVEPIPIIHPSHDDDGGFDDDDDDAEDVDDDHIDEDEMINIEDVIFEV